MNKNRNLSSPSVVTKSLSDLSTASASSSKFVWGGKPAIRKSTIIPPINNKTLFKSNATHLSLEKLDPLMYTDIESRGLVSRIVKYHDLSETKKEKLPIKNVYTKPGQFPIVHLKKNHLVNSPKRSNTTMVKIAPPDKSIYQAHTRSTILRMGSAVSKQDPELNKFEKSDIDHLKEISRKRINNDDLDTERNKKHCKEKNDQVDNTTKSAGLSGKILNDNFTAAKRQRESRASPSSAGSSPTEINQLNKKRLCGAKNNDISSSLSSSMTIVNKQKTNDNCIFSNKNEIITTPSITSLNKKQLKSDLNVSLNKSFDQQQQILITQTPATTSAITLNNEHLLKTLNDSNNILNENSYLQKYNYNNNNNNNNQLVEEVVNTQTPRLTLFNKKYNLNTNNNNKNNNIDKNILLSSDNDYENNINFIKPKIKAPLLLGSDKELVKRVEKDKLSLMLSCLSGDFDEDDDENIISVTAAAAVSQSLDVVDNKEKSVINNTSVAVTTHGIVAVTTTEPADIFVTQTSTTSITNVTTTPSLSGFQLIKPQLTTNSLPTIEKPFLTNNLDNNISNDLSNKIIEKPSEFKLNDDSSVPTITTASDLAVKPLMQFSSSGNSINNNNNSKTLIPSLVSTPSIIPTAAIAPQPASFNFDMTKNISSGTKLPTTNSSDVPRIGGFSFGTTNSTSTLSKTSPNNTPIFGNLITNNSPQVGLVGNNQSPIAFAPTSISNTTAPNVNPFGKSNNIVFDSNNKQTSSLPQNMQSITNKSNMFQFGDTKVNQNISAGSTVASIVAPTTNTFGTPVTSSAGAVVATTTPLFNFGQQQQSTNLFSNNELSKVPNSNSLLKAPQNTGFTMPTTNTFSFGDKTKDTLSNNSFSFNTNKTPTIGLQKSNVINFGTNNSNVDTPKSASPVFGKFATITGAASGDKINSPSNQFSFSQNNTSGFNAFNKTTTQAQVTTTGAATNAPAFSFGNTSKSPQFGMPTGGQQQQQPAPPTTTSSIFGGQMTQSFSFGQINSTANTTAPSNVNLATSQTNSAFNFSGNSQPNIPQFGNIGKITTGNNNVNTFNPDQAKKDFTYGGAVGNTVVDLTKPTFNFGGSGITSGIAQTNNNNSQPQSGPFNFTSPSPQTNNSIGFGIPTATATTGAEKTNKAIFGYSGNKPFSFSGSTNTNNNETTINQQQQQQQPSLTMGAASQAFNFTSGGNNLNNSTNTASSVSPFAFGNNNLTTANNQLQQSATFGNVTPSQNNLFSIGATSGAPQQRKIRTAARRLNK